MAEQVEDQGSNKPSRYRPGGTGLSGVSTQKMITDPRTGLTVVCDPESGVSATDAVRRVGSNFAANRIFDVHLIFNSQDQAIVNWIDEELRQRGIRPWLWNRDAQVFEKDEIESIKSTPVSAIFLSSRGWGQYHRKYAQLACDEKRPVIPIILGSCSQPDLFAVGNVFQVSKWIIFSSPEDTVALNELAQRIVNLPYVHETERDQAPGRGSKAVKYDPSVGRRLVVYVPARSQTIESWGSLRKKLENEPALKGCAWYPHAYNAGAWSRESVVRYARDLDASIRANVLEAGSEDLSTNISRITLIGHNLGGVLVRMAYLMSAGQYKEHSQGSEWWQKVDRIVLFGAPSRGISSKQLEWIERVAAYSPGRFGQMARDQLSGSEAITNLRIRWIRFFAELPSRGRPAIVQLLGKDYHPGNQDHSLDIEQFSQGWQYFVPGAKNEGLHVISGDAQGRYNTIRETILGPKPVGIKASGQTWVKPNPVIIVLHGIRANNEDWAAQICDGIQSGAPNALAIPPTYRYFSMLEFAIPWLREKKIRWFQDQYSSLLARYPKARFSFIGHSNGTYMLGHSLKRVPGMVFDRVTLVGSVLPREYDWNERFALGQVGHVTNHRSSFDVPVAIVCNLLRALGMHDVGTAGFDGFDQSRPEIKEVYYYNGGHGKPLERSNLQYLIEYTLSGKDDYPNAERNRAPEKLLSRLSGSPIVGLAVAVVLLVALCSVVWLLALAGTTLNVPARVAWVCATLIVIGASYLFSRYY